ncbi:Beta-ketoacyl-acyl-carrier-protein synthase I [Thalassovita gelatinovora]|uniref:Beta-ketoacyl-acyl-carrier-protein synthase I n=2 Tax=Thalassovita gelatinovora TaxID=53501 RepID=A0A0P1F906_THAGE|nr:type I polyketide synthase [Thalassovita gelatinovora]QIZ81263.1 type I polyketide synthase [Thalassovita gelatinovora]CUH64609.1 Beta-ketoacyl-acyl-carrier-protein synthase I [Thalassovita gelatinovora]SEP95029.1 Acyl transferase domain-containing protein [Thalassovita gelatinovora]
MPETIETAPTPTADIAIVGMAAHLPGAPTIADYWANLRDGIESIRHLSKEELLAAGEAPHMLERDDYVPAAAVLDGFKDFDAEFFGFSPKEAAILDPQHRHFLETAWEALENAGHPPENFQDPVGVFGGSGMGSYFYFNICSNRDLVDSTGMFLLRHTGNDKDFMVTRLSHVLDLKGPSVNVQTACSTSLVATHYACQSLLNGECDMALAGGVTIELPHARGYLYKEGEILSPDGHCHAFDHRAQGTVFGSGAGVVVLRRLEDAIADGDHIWAVIKGSAVNNDGAAKAGYLAPSVDGQAAAIADAQALSDVSADTIDYIECHGTGTYLGDPIEVAALTQAFQETTDETGFCRIGSVKTNIGHLDTAAGVASLIKASLALHNRQMPPSLGYEKPNPAIDFDHSPFRVNDTLTDWVSHKGPRRAGVNSLGVGGTNAHVVLEEAPERALSEESDWPFQILTVSGRNKSALEANSANLAAHLRAHPEQPLADVAWTLKEGRRAFERRRVVVAETHEDAADLLHANDPRRVFTHTVVGDRPEVVFMFPGGGAQYAGMARDLYETEPVFAEWMDRGLAVLQGKIDYDIRALWLPESGDEATANETLKKPSIQLPLIMIVEYALAQLWISWGVKPVALTGHSMGENTAACLAGVMSFEDCIGLVHLRGTLFDTVPAGGMLSVSLPAAELQPLLADDLNLAAVNAPGLSVASGPQAALDRLETELKAHDIDCQRIAINIAAHSRMLDPILDRFRAYLNSISLHPPQIPFTSNRTGQFITPDQATDPDYWVGHLRNTVLFADCIGTLAQSGERVFIEVGPGKALASLTGQHPDVTPNQVIGSLRHPQDGIADDTYFAAMLGRTWAVGVDFDWHQVWGEARRNRVVLPSYAFQRQEYFIEPAAAGKAPADEWLMRRDDMDNWAYRPVWKARYADCAADVTGDLSDAAKETWLIFEDETGMGADISKRLRMAGHQVISVRPGDAFAKTEFGYVLAPEHGRVGYDQLLQDLSTHGHLPSRILHLWLLTEDEKFRPGSSFFHRNQEYGFYSLLFLAQAISEQNAPTPLHITVVTSDAAQVRNETLRYPDKATVMGPARVIPREFPGITCSVLDVERIEHGKKRGNGPIFDNLLEEALATPANTVAAIRSDKRFELDFADIPFAPPGDIALRQGGTYLITGGFGGIGVTLAEALIERAQANIILLARTPLPDHADWADILNKTAPGDPVARRIRAVQQLEQAGGQVLVLPADVSNVEDMQDAVQIARDRFGEINGVIHAAGVIADAPIVGKSLSDIEDVFTPKIHGTQVLDTLFPDGTLDWMVLFSSSSTATTPAGQVDYVAANEFLNAFAKSRSGGQTRVMAIDWGIWADTGMAADAMAARTGAANKVKPEPAGKALLDLKSFDADGARLFTSTFSASDRWVFDEHRTAQNDILLPGTGYLELIHEALRSQGESGPYEIKDLFFLSPMQLDGHGDRQMRLRLPRSDQGYDIEIQSADRSTNRFEVNAQGSIALLPLAQPDKIDLAGIAARCGAVEMAPEGGSLPTPQEHHLNFGPRWRVLNTASFGKDEGIARLILPPEFREDLNDYALHPGLLDIATGWAMQLITGYRPSHLWVPASYHRLRIFAPLQGDLFSWVRNTGKNSDEGPMATFDITIAAPDGTVLLQIEGFSIRKLEGDTAFARTEAQLAEIDHRPLSPAEERLQHNLSQGIRREDGAEAFFRALASGQSQIVVSSLDLHKLIEQASDTVKADSSEQKFQRPELDQDYAAPETDVEKRLAGFFQELLGVDQVGVDDSFFDLGGHSLIAVRLFAKIKKSFGTDFAISVLFEAPTIRKIAAMLPIQGDAATEDQVVATVPERRFTHVVSMHQGEGGAHTPFFLVAGMFGNVLNLRHLAHILGNDRPFFGLQARGLYGDADPHHSIQDAARDYIAEMRQVQPHGPYMIGGFSGGGITAYEIAQQLTGADEDVSMLIMLDTPLPVRRPLSKRDRAMIQWLQLKEKGPLYPLQWASNRVRWEIAKRRGQGGTDQGPAKFHNAEIESAFLQAVGDYHLKPWNGPLQLYRPPLQGKWQVAPDRMVNSERAYVLPDNDWTQWAPQVQVFEVPGNHDSMVLEPNVRVLAARIKAGFKATEARQNHGCAPGKAAE